MSVAQSKSNLIKSIIDSIEDIEGNNPYTAYQLLGKRADEYIVSQRLNPDTINVNISIVAGQRGDKYTDGLNYNPIPVIELAVSAKPKGEDRYPPEILEAMEIICRELQSQYISFNKLGGIAIAPWQPNTINKDVHYITTDIG
jgi:hypothetical protein